MSTGETGLSATMICQNCHKNIATVTVIEILPGTTEIPGGGAAKSYQQQELCEICAQSKNLPHAPLEKKLLGDIWKLLQATGQPGQPGQPETEAPSAAQAALACPDCGMTREEFRRKGRLGCPNDYQIFASDVREILERVHGATAHSGRLPKVDQEQQDRLTEIAALRRELGIAIREEDYENAARIRDRLRELGVDQATEASSAPKSASEKHLE